ncbi:putative cross-wall-targeting lipoprotein signal domain-containing proteiin, partial [Acinetobacter baumannii]
MFKNNQVFSVRKSRKFRNLCGAIIAGAVLVVLGVGSA